MFITGYLMRAWGYVMSSVDGLRRFGYLLWFFAVLFVAVIVGEVWIIIETQTGRDELPSQLLMFTACDPDSYKEPVRAESGRWEQGPAQGLLGCDGVHPGIFKSTDKIALAVTGQVCNTIDRPVSVIVTVEWVTNSGVRFPTEITNLPITYQPGCNEPYRITWEPSNDVLQFMKNANRTTLWRIVGTADLAPMGIDHAELWDSVGSFTVTPADLPLN